MTQMLQRYSRRNPGNSATALMNNGDLKFSTLSTSTTSTKAAPFYWMQASNRPDSLKHHVILTVCYATGLPISEMGPSDACSNRKLAFIASSWIAIRMNPSEPSAGLASKLISTMLPPAREQEKRVG
jgi:hypothetical protein